MEDGGFIFTNIILPGASLLVGGLISLCISRHYFRKASKDLESKVYRLERITTAIALHLKHSGMIENVVLDERGVLKDFHVIQAGFSASTSRAYPVERVEQTDEPDSPTKDS